MLTGNGRPLKLQLRRVPASVLVRPAGESSAGSSGTCSLAMGGRSYCSSGGYLHLCLSGLQGSSQQGSVSTKQVGECLPGNAGTG